MKLITEHMQDLEYIVEGKGKNQYIRGVFMQSDVKNHLFCFEKRSKKIYN